MKVLKVEPFAAVTSVDELLAIAYAMEQEAVAGYQELAERMRRESKPELATVFDRLVEEESQHLGNVVAWSEKVSGKQPDLSNIRWELTETFDDEGARTIAPELLSAYRAFSIAVRNEERAFVFWSYVAAQTDQDLVRDAAEQMAHEELGHLTTLRRERRRAFHAARHSCSAIAASAPTLPELERRLADHLNAAAAKASDDAEASLRDLARQAQERSDNIARSPLGDTPLLRSVSDDVSDHVAPLCELLLDCYLDFGDRSPDEDNRNRAQEFAADVIRCRSAIGSRVS